MTKTQWEKHIRSKIEALKEKRKERQRELTQDKSFIPRRSLQEMYIRMIAEVECECEADNICDTCKLFSRLWQYTLDLFKDAAEGRSSYI